MNKDIWKKQVDAKIETLNGEVKRLFGGKLELPNYKIQYNIDHVKHLACVEYIGNKDRTTGEVTISEVSMKLNPYLLEEYKEIYIDNVVPHEFAHLVLNSIFPPNKQKELGIVDHGKEFKSICADLGYAHVGTESTSLFNDSQFLNARSRDGVPVFDYRCACKKHEITSARHLRIQNGSEVRCNICNDILEPI